MYRIVCSVQILLLTQKLAACFSIVSANRYWYCILVLIMMSLVILLRVTLVAKIRILRLQQTSTMSQRQHFLSLVFLVYVNLLPKYVVSQKASSTVLDQTNNCGYGGIDSHLAALISSRFITVLLDSM